MHIFMKYLKYIMPFLITLILWRLSVNFWNPGGILALIPVFYYTFVKPTDWFVLFGLVICFLIDYRCDLTLFWTFLFCLFYAANGLQKYIDISHSDKNAVYIFMFFIGIGFIILSFVDLNWKILINNIWLFTWISVLYTPITGLDKWIRND